MTRAIALIILPILFVTSCVSHSEESPKEGFVSQENFSEQIIEPNQTILSPTEIRQLKLQAKKGDSHSAFRLGKFYREQDEIEKANYFFSVAAANGDPVAQLLLADVLFSDSEELKRRNRDLLVRYTNEGNYLAADKLVFQTMVIYLEAKRNLCQLADLNEKREQMARSAESMERDSLFTDETFRELQKECLPPFYMREVPQ